MSIKKTVKWYSWSTVYDAQNNEKTNNKKETKYLYSIKKIQKLNAENNAKFLNLKIKGTTYFEANE